MTNMKVIASIPGNVTKHALTQAVSGVFRISLTITNLFERSISYEFQLARNSLSRAWTDLTTSFKFGKMIVAPVSSMKATREGTVDVSIGNCLLFIQKVIEDGNTHPASHLFMDEPPDTSLDYNARFFSAIQLERTYLVEAISEISQNLGFRLNHQSTVFGPNLEQLLQRITAGLYLVLFFHDSAIKYGVYHRNESGHGFYFDPQRAFIEMGRPEIQALIFRENYCPPGQTFLFSKIIRQ